MFGLFFCGFPRICFQNLKNISNFRKTFLFLQTTKNNLLIFYENFPHDGVEFAIITSFLQNFRTEIIKIFFGQTKIKKFCEIRNIFCIFGNKFAKSRKLFLQI